MKPNGGSKRLQFATQVREEEVGLGRWIGWVERGFGWLRIRRRRRGGVGCWEQRGVRAPLYVGDRGPFG